MERYEAYSTGSARPTGKVYQTEEQKTNIIACGIVETLENDCKTYK